MLLEDLKPGLRIDGLIPSQSITVVAAQWHGASALELTFKTAAGGLDQQVLFRRDEDKLTIAQSGGRAFDAPASDFMLAAEAQRITLAGLFDPMLAVATSEVQPLPHQIRAVYGELLPRTPLRFLLADDPGAGKTIMAGLYIKELLLRDDVRRCMIVAPGGLVEQWQDELFFKFGLQFDILTTQQIGANLNINVFESASPLLIARMDQLSRNEQLRDQLRESEWDLIVIDEAHRMGAHYFGGKLVKTKRFQLGEMLGEITRHLLLMTATPHSGKEEDFQLFLTLLDRDRFEGKRSTTADTSGVMRRMVKEDLLTFEGKKLFPERIAETVPYELTALEFDLYEDVTAYVREGMNRADRLGGNRRNTVGFALTVLQRRLASSPEAIHRSLIRRSERLERKRREILDGTYSERPLQTFEIDDLNAHEVEELEEELLDAATAAQTVEELAVELLELSHLIHSAQVVREAGTDRKWSELRKILVDNALIRDVNGRPRKLIIFTEHRDTLNYLKLRIDDLLRSSDAVRVIHGGVSRQNRRLVTEEFTKNQGVQILLATDAAGEGLNLQAAHLMVNYDLPWNPNRIEQRFGRIHRIGQTEVCRLWNLVASNTREGEVFMRLLKKLDQMRKAFGGKVFDVLGEALNEAPLRDLLLDAIKYGDRPEVRARMYEVIDASIGDGLREILGERALVSDHLTEHDLDALRTAMESASHRRLHPRDIESAFRASFSRLGGRMVKRENRRYEITHVPGHIRASTRGPIPSRYDRATFDPQYVVANDLSRADLLAPGHLIHDAVMEQTIKHYGGSLNSGTVLASSAVTEPHLLVAVIEEVSDATGRSVARRFGYAFVDKHGTTTSAGPAPYLDCTPADGSVETAARTLPWLAEAESRAKSWIIANRLPAYLDEIQSRRSIELGKLRHLINVRLQGERERLVHESAVAAGKERRREKTMESSESLRRKAEEIDHRLRKRLELIDRQLLMSTKPPRILTAALVVPAERKRQPIDRG